jgi:FixJ family two-component response regulator
MVRSMSASKPPPLVAVVEDDAAVRKALCRLLHAAGFEAANYESAEAYIAASPSPMCIIVDVGLPGMSGLELQERLCAAGNPPPIIVITAHHDSVVRERAQKSGCAEFFLKPIDGNVLIATIESLANALPIDLPSTQHP